MTIYSKIFRSNYIGMKQWSQPSPLPVWSQKWHQCLRMELNIKTFWCSSKKCRMYKLFLCWAFSALSLRSYSAMYYFFHSIFLPCFYNVPGMVLEPRGHLLRNSHFSQGRQRQMAHQNKAVLWSLVYGEEGEVRVHAIFFGEKSGEKLPRFLRIKEICFHWE